jgi:hypothetical protein
MAAAASVDLIKKSFLEVFMILIIYYVGVYIFGNPKPSARRN